MIQAPPHSFADFLGRGGRAGVLPLAISIISLVVSVGVLLRTLYLDRSHLWFIHKRDQTEQSFLRALHAESPGAHTAIGTATLIISNNSSRPNAIIGWSASVKNALGNDLAVEMWQGSLADPNRAQPSEFPPHNVTPIVLPAFNSAEAHLLFIVDLRILPNPVVFEVKAEDRTKRMYQISVSIPNVVRNTFD